MWVLVAMKSCRCVQLNEHCPEGHDTGTAPMGTNSGSDRKIRIWAEYATATNLLDRSHAIATGSGRSGPTCRNRILGSNGKRDGCTTGIGDEGGGGGGGYLRRGGCGDDGEAGKSSVRRS
mmetsp:Transcript_14878/g.26265  ORF Transcript_14878/g.26265 Transcript_14878/m.26265 type:complete len:120 (-) Transcript_14878:535-894(-)